MYLICARTFWRFIGMRHLNKWVNCVFIIEIRVRASVWVGKTGIPLWTCYNSNTPVFQIRKLISSRCSRLHGCQEMGLEATSVWLQSQALGSPFYSLEEMQHGCAGCSLEPVSCPCPRLANGLLYPTWIPVTQRTLSFCILEAHTLGINPRRRQSHNFRHRLWPNEKL